MVAPAATVKVTFENTLRARPIVLTQHQVQALSEQVGRDVLPELQAIRGERYEAKTLGQLMRALAEVLLNARQHLDSAECWCRPKVMFIDEITRVSVWVHKQVQ